MSVSVCRKRSVIRTDGSESTGGLAGRILVRLAGPAALLVPATLLFVFFFVWPLAALAVNSFYDYSRLTGIIEELTTKNYERIVTDSFYLFALLRTLKLALMTSIAVAVIGYPVAFYLSITTPRQRAWITLCILSPLLVSVIVRTFGWLVILGPNGLTDTLLAVFGLGPVKILHTEAAVVLGLANVLLPFFVLSVATRLQATDPAIPLAAASLGASPLMVIVKVIVPLSLPGVLAGLLIVFSLASSSFVTPALLGGSDYKVLSTLIYQQALVFQNWPLSAALAVVLVGVVLAILFIQSRALEHGKYKVVFH